MKFQTFAEADRYKSGLSRDERFRVSIVRVREWAGDIEGWVDVWCVVSKAGY